MRQNILKGLPCCCALLCAAVHAVRCCALRALGIGRHAHPLHDFTPSWLAAEVCPMQVSPKHKQQSRFCAAAARAGHVHPRRTIASSAARESKLSTAGFCFRSSTSSATGLNPSNFRRAFRMRRSKCVALAPSQAGPANSVNGQVCDAGHGHPRRRMASSAARELNSSTAGFCFMSSTSSATGLNPSNYRRAIRMPGPRPRGPHRLGQRREPGWVITGQRRQLWCACAGQTKQPQERAPPPSSQGRAAAAAPAPRASYGPVRLRQPDKAKRRCGTYVICNRRIYIWIQLQLRKLQPYAVQPDIKLGIARLGYRLHRRDKPNAPSLASGR